MQRVHSLRAMNVDYSAAYLKIVVYNSNCKREIPALELA